MLRTLPLAAVAVTVAGYYETLTGPPCLDSPCTVASTQGDTLTTSTGLPYIEGAAGTGDSTAWCKAVAVHYDGYLLNGTKFDSSRDLARALIFTPGLRRADRWLRARRHRPAELHDPPAHHPAPAGIRVESRALHSLDGCSPNPALIASRMLLGRASHGTRARGHASRAYARCPRRGWIGRPRPCCGGSDCVDRLARNAAGTAANKNVAWSYLPRHQKLRNAPAALDLVSWGCGRREGIRYRLLDS
jgi:hypothetical protein